MDRASRTGGWDGGDSRRSGPSRNLLAWTLALAYAAVVSYLHFELGLGDRLYWTVAWWDLLTHSAAGLGVAAIGYLLAPRLFRSPVALLVTLPLVVLAAGAWFEVYERVFRTFWLEWSHARYVEDTLVDLVMDVLGAYAFAGWVLVRRLLRGRRTDGPTHTGGRRRPVYPVAGPDTAARPTGTVEYVPPHVDALDRRDTAVPTAGVAPRDGRPRERFR